MCPAATCNCRLIAESARTAGADAARCHGSGARCRLDRARDRCRRVRPAADHRRHRRRPHRRDGDGVGRRGELIAHGIALQPGRTSASAVSKRHPWSCCPVRRIRHSRRGGGWRCRRSDRLSGRKPGRHEFAAGAQDRLQRRRHRDRARGTEIRAPGSPLAFGELSLDAIARAEAWLVISANRRGLRRALRSMPIC